MWKRRAKLGVCWTAAVLAALAGCSRNGADSPAGASASSGRPAADYTPQDVIVAELKVGSDGTSSCQRLFGSPGQAATAIGSTASGTWIATVEKTDGSPRPTLRCSTTVGSGSGQGLALEVWPDDAPTTLACEPPSACAATQPGQYFVRIVRLPSSVHADTAVAWLDAVAPHAKTSA